MPQHEQRVSSPTRCVSLARGIRSSPTTPTPTAENMQARANLLVARACFVLCQSSIPPLTGRPLSTHLTATGTWCVRARLRTARRIAASASTIIAYGNRRKQEAMADSAATTAAAAAAAAAALAPGNEEEEDESGGGLLPPLPAPPAIKAIDRSSVARICSGQVRRRGGGEGCCLLAGLLLLAAVCSPLH